MLNRVHSSVDSSVDGREQGPPRGGSRGGRVRHVGPGERRHFDISGSAALPWRGRSGGDDDPWAKYGGCARDAASTASIRPECTSAGGKSEVSAAKLFCFARGAHKRASSTGGGLQGGNPMAQLTNSLRWRAPQRDLHVAGDTCFRAVACFLQLHANLLCGCLCGPVFCWVAGRQPRARGVAGLCKGWDRYRPPQRRWASAARSWLITLCVRPLSRLTSRLSW
jgi:hypothetical protein